MVESPWSFLMSDSYQAVYDAVRSRISNADIGAAVESAFREANLGHYAYMTQMAMQEAISGYMRPSAVYRPKIYPDGNEWCTLYGENLQEGVAGFGDSPEIAMHEFDKAWNAKMSERIAS